MGTFELKAKLRGWEVMNDIGGVSPPKQEETLFPVHVSEGITNTLVRGGETTLLDLNV